MSRTLGLCARKMICFLCGAVLLGFAVPVHADPKPLTKEEQAKVDKAIEKGVAFLKRSQRKGGDWPWKMYNSSFFVGQCALPAYALLEAGVSTDDPVIRKAADYIRPRVLTNDKTYELSLAILFFDHLGEPKDKKLIQTLALRLIAGQHHTGGWTYSCPILNTDGEQVLLESLKYISKEMRAKSKTREQTLTGLAVPIGLRSLSAFQSARNLQWPETRRINDPWALTSKTDNSNTQFAILGLW
ncbi:MAG: hypothetical protein ACRELG_06670, partial [Gemmataceae bacterium]